jgi:thymidine kinase
MLEIITGCMFAGKTEEVLRRVRRAIIARKKVLLVSHCLDERYVPSSITSHDLHSYEAQAVDSIEAIAELIEPDTEVLVIDEAQFFDDSLGLFCSLLVDSGLWVIAAGLELDFRGEPFGAMPRLLAYADRVDKLMAVCTVCGQPASRTQRLLDGRPASYHEPQIVVASADMYEARCRRHHQVPDHPLEFPLAPRWERLGVTEPRRRPPAAAGGRGDSC